MLDAVDVRRFFLAVEASRQANAAKPIPSLREWIEAAAPEQGPVPWHLQQLVQLFERAMRERVFALVSMPPRHAKSTTVRRALAYAILRHPDRLNAFVTYATGYARTHSRAIKRLVVKHGGVLAADAKNVDNWRTVAEGGLSVSGRDGQLTGKGFPGLLVVDDLLKNRKEAESTLIREQAFEGFNDDIYTRSEPPFGSIIVVATRWKEDDVTGRLEAERDEKGEPVWKVINLPAIRDPETGDPTDADDGLALWPERFPLEDLRRIRRKLGPYGWWSLYQGRPRPRDGKIFKVSARWSTRPEGLHVVLASDPAGSKKTKANHTVTVAVGFKVVDGILHGWLLGLLRVRLAPPEAAAEQLAFQRRFGEPLHLEGSRDGLAQAEAAHAIAPDLVIRIIRAIEDKFTRAQPLASAWNGNTALHEPARFFVPERAELIGCSAEDLANYLRVFEKFTGQDDPEDDDVDATAHAWNVGQSLDLASVPVAPPAVEIETPWSESHGF